MNDIKTLFNLCLSILAYKIDLYGYSISLWNVFIFSVLGYILLYFVFKMLD